MNSPNEPGYPRAGEAPGGANGSAGGASSHDGGSPARSTGDVPPWQRGPAARAARQSRPAPEPHTRSEAGRADGPHTRPEAARADGPHTRSEAARADGPAGHSPAVDARLNRFIAGGSSAPAHEQDAPPPRGERTETVRPEAYASELPDLSGPSPRVPQPRKPERPSPEPTRSPGQGTSRLQVGTRHKGPVRATMQIRRIDPWSTLKVSLVLSAALFFVWMIAVAFLYLVLGGMGVWSKLNSNVGDLLTSSGGSAGGELVSSGTIFGGAALIGLVNIVLMTAMATCAAFIYNLITDLVGGVEVTLADRD